MDTLPNTCGSYSLMHLCFGWNVRHRRVSQYFYFLLCQHPALATTDNSLPISSSGQYRDVRREVYSSNVHGSINELPHVETIADNHGLQIIQICACSKDSINRLSHGLAIHSVCIHSTLKGYDPSQLLHGYTLSQQVILSE